MGFKFWRSCWSIISRAHVFGQISCILSRRHPYRLWLGRFHNSSVGCNNQLSCKQVFGQRLKYSFTFFSYNSSSSPFGKFSNGFRWIKARSLPFFWVLPNSRIHIHLPFPTHNPLVIGPKGTLLVDYSNLFIGESWSQCFLF